MVKVKVIKCTTANSYQHDIEEWFKNNSNINIITMTSTISGNNERYYITIITYTENVSTMKL